MSGMKLRGQVSTFDIKFKYEKKFKINHVQDLKIKSEPS